MAEVVVAMGDVLGELTVAEVPLKIRWKST